MILTHLRTNNESCTNKPDLKRPQNTSATNKFSLFIALTFNHSTYLKAINIHPR